MASHSGGILHQSNVQLFFSAVQAHNQSQFDALNAAVVATTVARLNEPTAGRHSLIAAQECGLTPALASSSLYWVVADVPVLLDPGPG